MSLVKKYKCICFNFSFHESEILQKKVKMKFLMSKAKLCKKVGIAKIICARDLQSSINNLLKMFYFNDLKILLHVNNNSEKDFNNN